MNKFLDYGLPLGNIIFVLISSDMGYLKFSGVLAWLCVIMFYLKEDMYKKFYKED